MIEYLYKIYEYLHSYFTENLVENTNLFFGGNILYLVLFVVSLVLIIVNKKDKNDAKRFFIPYILIFLILVMYNPFWKALFLKFPASVGGAVYVRFWLICPVWVLIAYTLSDGLSDCKNRMIKCFGIVALTVMLILSGNTLRALNMVNEPHNPYKIRTESIEVADLILADTDYKPTSLLILILPPGVDENYAEGGAIFTGLQQYSGIIKFNRFSYDEDFLNTYLLTEQTPDGAAQEDWLNWFLNVRYNDCGGFEYVALPDYDCLIDRMEYCGYGFVGNAGGYNVYRANEE